MNQKSSRAISLQNVVRTVFAITFLPAFVSLQAAAQDVASPRFDVNDVSYLWPVPTKTGDLDELIPATEKLSDGNSSF